MKKIVKIFAAFFISAVMLCCGTVFNGRTIRADEIMSDETVPLSAKPQLPVKVEIKIAAAIISGVYTFRIVTAAVREAVDEALSEAQRTGNASGIVIEANAMPFENSETFQKLSVTLEEGAALLLDASGAGLIVYNPICCFMLDRAAIKSIASRGGDITFTSAPVKKVSAQATAAIGNRRLFDFLAASSDGTQIEDYGGGAIIRSVTYIPDGNELVEHLCVYKVADGKLSRFRSAVFENGWMLWSGTGNGIYGVGYHSPVPEFTDTESHWAREQIRFSVRNRLLSPESETLFAPDKGVTRAEFLKAICLLAGAEPANYLSSRFSDVTAADPAMPYIEWAVDNKIISGTGGGHFNPNAVITREQSAVMLYNLTKAVNLILPEAAAPVQFTDRGSVSPWASEAAQALYRAEVFSVRGNGIFNPLGGVSKSEAANILFLFNQKVLDANPSRGWTAVENDRWMFLDVFGRAHTGWKFLYDDWYFFNESGILATDAMVDGYYVDADGIRR